YRRFSGHSVCNIVFSDYRACRALHEVMTCIVDGCGEPVKTYVRLGKVVKHVKCNDHYSLSQRGRRADETYIDKDGYVQVWHEGKRIAQHRVVMQEKLGRKLERNESVHHVNGIRTDNRP